MAFGTSHRAYVSTQGRGYGRHVYTVACSCGARLGTYDRHQSAQSVALQHEKKAR